jgi:hypothetical protein
MAVDPEIQEATKFRDRDGEIARERHEDDQCRAFGHGCSFA